MCLTESVFNVFLCGCKEKSLYNLLTDMDKEHTMFVKRGEKLILDVNGCPSAIHNSTIVSPLFENPYFSDNAITMGFAVSPEQVEKMKSIVISVDDAIHTSLEDRQMVYRVFSNPLTSEQVKILDEELQVDTDYGVVEKPLELCIFNKKFWCDDGTITPDAFDTFDYPSVDGVVSDAINMVWQFDFLNVWFIFYNGDDEITMGVHIQGKNISVFGKEKTEKLCPFVVK